MRFIKSRNNRKIIGILGVLLILFVVKTLMKEKSPLTFWDKENKLQTVNDDKIQGYRTTKRIKKGEEIKKTNIEAIFCNKEKEPADLEEILESRAKVNLESGIVLNSSNLDSKKKLTDDMRIHNFPYIRLTDHMKKGDYIDVRISFSNGGDFVLLSKKRIEDITFMDTEGTKGNSLWLSITEEELLRLSSAVVDAYLHEGCQIYAIQYINKLQKAAVINYSVSTFVRQLMEDDPNITKRAESVMEWNLWEEYKEKEENQRKLLYPEKDIEKDQSSTFDVYPEKNTKKVFQR